MSQVNFASNQKVAAVTTTTEDGFALQVHTKATEDNEALSSNVFEHTFSEGMADLEKIAATYGFENRVKISYNGEEDPALVIAKANKAIEALQNGSFTTRAPASGEAKAPSYLLQAVMVLNPYVTQEVWADLSGEERATYRTDAVLQLKEDLEVAAKADAAKARLANLSM